MIKLKVFVVKKVEDDYSNMFRSCTKHKNITPIAIGALSQFNRISISNPQHNKCIYTISRLQFRTTGANKASLIIGESDSINISSNEIILEDSPIINYGYKNDSANNSIELLSIDTQPNVYQELLEDYHLFIVPGGSIFIELSSPVKFVDINLDVIEENF